MAASTKALLDLKEAAQLLRISERNVRRLVHLGNLPFHRVGRQLRFDADELLGATRGKAARSA